MGTFCLKADQREGQQCTIFTKIKAQKCSELHKTATAFAHKLCVPVVSFSFVKVLTRSWQRRKHISVSLILKLPIFYTQNKWKTFPAPLCLKASIWCLGVNINSINSRDKVKLKQKEEKWWRKAWSEILLVPFFAQGKLWNSCETQKSFQIKKVIYKKKKVTTSVQGFIYVIWKRDKIHANAELTADVDKIWSSDRDATQNAQLITSHYSLQIHNFHQWETFTV